MSQWGSTTTTTEIGGNVSMSTIFLPPRENTIDDDDDDGNRGTYRRAQCSSPHTNVRYSIGTELPPNRMEEIHMLGRLGDEYKGATWRGRSGDNITSNNDNNDNNHCNYGLRYVRLSLSDTDLANKIPCNFFPPAPPPPPQHFLPGPWTHFFKVRKNLPKLFTLFYSLRHV